MSSEVTVNPQPPDDNHFAGMAVKLTMLTPEMAAEFAKNTRWQRRQAKRTIKKYALQQSSGQWHNYPALFILDKAGYVLDGAHRTAAVNLSQVAIPITLLTGVDPKTVHAIDIGKPRNLQTNLELDGEKAARELSYLLKFLKSYRAAGDFETFNFTIEDYYELLHEEPQVRELAVEWTVKCNLPKVSIGLFAVADYLVRQHAHENKYDFFLDCCRGEAVAEGDPAFAFREWVINLPPKRTQKVAGRIGYTLIQCWDKFRRGQQVTRVRAPGECPEIAPLEETE